MKIHFGMAFLRRVFSLSVAAPVALSVLALAGHAPNTAASDDPSLLAWYTFDKFSGANTSGVRKALDSSGKGNDATMRWSKGTFAMVADGADGASLKFNNGARTTGGAYLQLPSALLKNADSFTISMWFKLTSAAPQARLFDFATAATNAPVYIRYSPYTGNTQALIETKAASGTASTMPFTGSNRVGEWVHVAVTRDSKATRIYKNGALYAQGEAGLSPKGLDFLGAYIGRSDNVAHSYFDGEMDDIRIYGRALSPADVMGQYRAYPRIANLKTSGGPYLMSYTLPAGFSGHLSDSAAPDPAAIEQVGVFDYSLHYAYSEDGKTWVPLFDNRGVLYWLDNGSYNADTSYRYLNPRIAKSGNIYTLYADAYRYRNNAIPDTYLRWTSTDLINWTQEGTQATAPALPDNPTTIDTASKPYNALFSPNGGVIAITRAQLKALRDAFEAPAFDEVKLATVVGTPAKLPNYGTITLNNGRQVDYGHSVTWEGLPDCSTPGTYRITGTVNYSCTNPVNKNGADPRIFYHDGWYYYTASWMDDSIAAASQNESNQYQYVTLRRGKTIAELVTAQTAAQSRAAGFYPANPDSKEKLIFEPSSRAPGSTVRGSAHIWAPEMHRVTFNGVSTWAIYFAASPLSSRWDTQLMVSTCTDADPWTGTWTTTALDDGNPESFDLDATVLEHKGQYYLIWANRRGASHHPLGNGNSSAWIAKMTSPTTIDQNQANQVMLLTPEYTFEDRNDRVLEGFTAMKADGRIWLSYSVGSVNANYSMGLAYADENADLMKASSWTKLKYPIMHSNRASKQFGPGHAAFGCDYNEAGRGPFPILTYHARGDESYVNNHAPAPLYSPTRWARVAPVYFHRNGTPYVGIPPADGQIPAPPIYGTITVLAAVSDADAVAADASALKIGSDAPEDGIDLNDFEMNAILPTIGPSGITTVRWATSDPTVMTADGKNLVTFGAKPVTLTATIARGGASATRTFALTCKPPVYGYLLAYFIGNAGPQQQNFLALSRDGLNFTWLNNNTKIMTIAEGEQCARDHFIIKDPNREMYYMLATDLNAHKASEGKLASLGYPSGFNTWGNKAIFVWKSPDLINWSLTSHTNFAGLDSPYAFTRGWANAWAPEAIWVSDHANADGTTGAFMMFWSASPQNGTAGYNGNTDRNRIVCSFTKDFSQGSFTNPQELYRISDEYDDQIIDACIEWDPSVRRWQMYFRRGARNAHIERVTSVGEAIPSSTSGWTNRATDLPGTLFASASYYEGPDMNKVIGKQEWRMIADHFAAPEAFAIFKTTDFTNFTEIKSPETNIGMSLSGIGSGGRVRHGYIIRISRERYDELARRALAGSW